VSDVPRVVAAFDFDGTLSRRDTLVPFLVDVVGRARVARALASDAPRIAAMTVGRADRDAAKARLVERVLAGVAHADVAARGHAYAQRVVEHGLRPQTVARLRWHRSQGHDIVIVSASLDAYLHDIAGLLGVDALLCTTLEVVDGVVTGALTGGNCRGPEKATRLRNWLDGDTVTLWAYGDSSGDHELLALADQAVYVTRRGRLTDAPDGVR
jgi:HAD superfamily hydrolase (TIGR01490 family)